MATRDHNAKKNNNLFSICCNTSFLFLSVLSLASVLFIIYSLKSSTNTDNHQTLEFNNRGEEETSPSKHSKPSFCNYTDGAWIYDQKIRSTRYDNTCKEIFKGWNCISSDKSNAREISKWRWEPHGCDLPLFDPVQFLKQFRNTNIGFVGDSLNRNMFVSLVCTLKQVSNSNEIKKWRPSGADRGYTFLKYNLTLAYHRTNLLARYGRWWAPSKFDPVNSPMLFFEKNVPVIPPIQPDIGLDMVLKHMISFVEKKMRPDAIKFFRTQSPRHFEGGDWDQGGSCPRVQPLAPGEVEELFSLKNNGTNVEARLVNQHLYKALEGSRFHILDVTHMSEFRADAHPSTAGGKKHDDCMHWCLPGITDTWNDLLIIKLNNLWN